MGALSRADVNEPNFSFTIKPGYCIAEPGYSRSVAGNLNSECCRREFPAERGAYEFVRDLQNKAVAVRCNPVRPGQSDPIKHTRITSLRYLALWPVPVRATVWGLPPPPSEMETSAVRRPVVVGLKVTVMSQLAEAATLG
jgi:hypothetical protein